MKCIEDEIPFDLPEGWAWTRMSSIIQLFSGQDLTPDRYNDAGNGIPYITGASNLDDGKVIINRWTTSPTTHSTTGDLLLTVKGSGVGKMAYSDIEDAHIARQIMALRCEAEVENRYLGIIVSALISDIVSKANGLIPGISRDVILNTLCPLPPKKEQRIIVEKANAISSIVDALESNSADLEKSILIAKSKILDLAIRGQLVPQDPADEPASVLLERIRTEKEELIKTGKIKRDKKESVIFKGEDNSYYEKIGDTVTCIDEEIPFDIPENWCWSRGFSCFSGMTTKKPEAEFFDYIDIDSIDNKKHIVTSPKHLPSSEAPSRASRGLQNGSVVFSLVRPYLENIAFIDENLMDCIASTGFFVCNSNGSFFPPFMFYLMLSEYVINGLNEYMKGDNSPSISKENIETWLYPVPPFEEQKCIVGRICELLSHIATIEAGLN